MGHHRRAPRGTDLATSGPVAAFGYPGGPAHGEINRPLPTAAGHRDSNLQSSTAHTTTASAFPGVSAYRVRPGATGPPMTAASTGETSRVNR